MPDCGSSLSTLPVSKRVSAAGMAMTIGAGPLLQRGDAADMVEMLVAGADQRTSLSLKPSRSILAAIDSAPASAVAAVDQDMALGRR